MQNQFVTPNIEWDDDENQHGNNMQSSHRVTLVAKGSGLVKPSRARSSDRRLLGNIEEPKIENGGYNDFNYYYHDESQRPGHGDEEQGWQMKAKAARTRNDKAILYRDGSTANRRRNIPSFFNEQPVNNKPASSTSKWTAWNIYVAISTFFIPNIFLSRVLGKDSADMRKAFRDKLALIYIILFLSALIGFMSVGLSPLLCPGNSNQSKVYIKELRAGTAEAPFNGPWIIAKGWVYSLSDFKKVYLPRDGDGPNFEKIQRSDISERFSTDMNGDCAARTSDFSFPCAREGSCFDSSLLPTLKSSGSARLLFYEYNDINSADGKNITYYNGNILDLTEYLSANNQFLGPTVHDILVNHLQRDATMALKRLDASGRTGACLSSIFSVGNLSKMTPGCFSNRLIMLGILALVVCLTLFRFLAAVIFNWIYSVRLDTLTKRYKISHRRENSKEPMNTSFPFTAILVTCYSEDEQSIRGTLESLAHTDYFDEYKMLFIVCDGLVTGKGNVANLVASFNRCF